MKYRPTILLIASDDTISRVAEDSLPPGRYRTTRGVVPGAGEPDLVLRQWNDPQPRPADMNAPVLSVDLLRCAGAELRCVVARVLGTSPLLG